mgnify:FL=1
MKDRKIAKPTCKSFKEVCSALEDPLIKAKLHFFISVAKEINPFLKIYQTDQPMLPFLATDLGGLVQNLLTRFIKADIMSSALSVTAVTKVDFECNGNQVDTSKINVGFSASKLLLAKELSDKQKYTFRAECRSFLIAVLKKLLDKSPLKYPLVKNMSWLDPRLMLSQKDKTNGVTKLTRVLRILCETGRIHESKCDTIISEYGKFLDDIVSNDSQSFRSFVPSKNRLDKLMYSTLADRKEFSELWAVVQILLLLSHGQATVERGFSVNKNVTTENLSKESLIAQRLIIDNIRRVGGPHKIVITKGLLAFASSARQKYWQYLDDKKQEAIQLEKSSKRK